jgi:hypothetical protein
MDTCSTDKITIRKITQSVAKEVIIKNHYTHAWTACKHSLGIYHKVSDSVFGDEKLIGVVIYGHPVGRLAHSSVSSEIKQHEILELTRLWIEDGWGKNIESYSISQSFKWLKENDKDIKVLLSYADVGQNHNGTIYQATNWLYQGLNYDIKFMEDYKISLSEKGDEWIHQRTMSSRWGSCGIDVLKQKLAEEGYTEFWRKKDKPKHRYIYILTDNKKDKKKILTTLKHPTKPYPKETIRGEDEIEHFYTNKEKVDNGSNFW